LTSSDADGLGTRPKTTRAIRGGAITGDLARSDQVAECFVVAF
jgi:hypothetical protein